MQDCKQLVEKLYMEGVPVREIARQCGNSMFTVYRVLHTLEKEKRIKLRRGHYKQHKRLSDEEKERIVKMYLAGETVYKIAKKLGRHPSTVYSFLKRSGVIR